MIRVLIVDDSHVVRRILADALKGEPDIEVVGVAPDPFVARDMILELKPDVLTLDIEMPRMDGLSFLKRLMHFHPLPVVIISSLAQAGCAAALEALDSGAVEVLAKPNGPYSVGDLRYTLANKLRAASKARLKQAGKPEAGEQELVAPEGEMVIAIGASTGGVEAIFQVLCRMPADAPPILIAQHIPANFSRAFAQRLTSCCRIEVREAAAGDVIRRGLALIAPGDYHMVLRPNGRISLNQGPRVCYQRPSVDVLFTSVAEVAGRESVGILLTGMGADGAKGLLRMREAGAATIVQDEATSVVFGMPREAIRLGAALRVLPLPEIAREALLAKPPIRQRAC